MTESLLPEVAAPIRDVLPLQDAIAHVRPLRAHDAHIVAEIGRGALILASLLVVCGSAHPLSPAALIGVTLATLVWLVALKSSAASGRVVLGCSVAAGIGTTAGLVAVAALNSSALGLHLPLPWLVGSALGVFGSVTAWDWFVGRTIVARRRVLVVGAEGIEDSLDDELRRCPDARFDVVGAVAGSADLATIVHAQHPDIVVLTDETTCNAVLDRLLDARANVQVAGLTSFYEYAFGRVPIERITPAWFMSLLHPRQHIYSRFSKRAFDVVLAGFGLLASAPLLSLLALLTKTTRGPILYRQTRVGEHGRHFTIYKFRTMGCDAERDGATLSRDNDPRSTRVGRVLRRTHLDELPQLWNVLKGDMSIVGPRPERPEFIELLEAAVPFWNRRLLVKPGITGWAQVRCDYASDCESMAQKLSYDLWYLRNRSLVVDLAICVKTAGLQLQALFAGRNRKPLPVSTEDGALH